MLAYAFTHCLLKRLSFTYQSKDEIPLRSSCNHKIHPNSHKWRSQHTEKDPCTRLCLCVKKDIQTLRLHFDEQPDFLGLYGRIGR